MREDENHTRTLSSGTLPYGSYKGVPRPSGGLMVTGAFAEA